MPRRKNVPTVSLLATVYYVLKAVIDPDIPPNGGYYRAIEVVAPPGTVLNPLPPAAVAARFTTCQTVADVVLSAFAQAVPERVVAHWHGGTLAIYSGTDPAPRRVLRRLRGVRRRQRRPRAKDGIDGIANHTTNTSNLPIEALESEFPILVERYGVRSRLRVDPAGSAADWRSSAKCAGWPATSWSAAGDATSARRPAGSAAAAPGCRARSRSSGPTVHQPDGAVHGPGPGRSGPANAPGAHVRRRRPGDPLDRDPALVRRDVRLDKVSPAHAESAYGVVVRDGEVDVEATRRLRARRAPHGQGGET